MPCVGDIFRNCLQLDSSDSFDMFLANHQTIDILWGVIRSGRGVIRRGLGRKMFCESGETTSIHVP
jgi:hypothetical protein